MFSDQQNVQVAHGDCKSLYHSKLRVRSLNAETSMENGYGALDLN